MGRLSRYEFSNQSVSLIEEGDLTAEGIVYTIAHGIRNEMDRNERAETEEPSIEKRLTAQQIQIETRLPFGEAQSKALAHMAVDEVVQIDATEPFDQAQWQSGEIDDFEHNWHS